jgi:hypothetical protein
MSDGSNVDVATNLELGHLDHVLKWPPADPTIEVFVEVRVGGRRGDSAGGTSPGRVEHVPRWSQDSHLRVILHHLRHVPHFIFAISYLLSHLPSATGHGYAPGYITKFIMDGKTYFLNIPSWTRCTLIVQSSLISAA